MIRFTSNFLFADASFFEGVARIWDFGNILNQYNSSPTPEIADARALRADFRLIGQDLSDVLAREVSRVPEKAKQKKKGHRSKELPRNPIPTY